LDPRTVCPVIAVNWSHEIWMSGQLPKSMMTVAPAMGSFLKSRMVTANLPQRPSPQPSGRPFVDPSTSRLGPCSVE
jgi:hypothetical protein